MSTAKLKFLLACENSQGIQLPNGETKVVLVQPIIKMGVPFIPTQAAFDVSAGVIDIEEQRSFTFKLTIFDPDNVEIASQSIAGTQPPSPDSGSPVFILGSSMRNVIIPKAGKYTVFVHIDNEELGHYSFEVIEQEMHKNGAE